MRFIYHLGWLTALAAGTASFAEIPGSTLDRGRTEIRSGETPIHIGPQSSGGGMGSTGGVSGTVLTGTTGGGLTGSTGLVGTTGSGGFSGLALPVPSGGSSGGGLVGNSLPGTSGGTLGAGLTGSGGAFSSQDPLVQACIGGNAEACAQIRAALAQSNSNGGIQGAGGPNTITGPSTPGGTSPQQYLNGVTSTYAQNMQGALAGLGAPTSPGMANDMNLMNTILTQIQESGGNLQAANANGSLVQEANALLAASGSIVPGTGGMPQPGGTMTPGMGMMGPPGSGGMMPYPTPSPTFAVSAAETIDGRQRELVRLLLPATGNPE
jgi:hypothetical protein